MLVLAGSFSAVSSASSLAFGSLWVRFPGLENMCLVVRNRSLGFPTRSHTNQAVQPQKMAKGLKCRIQVEEGLRYPYNENKVTDQLHSYGAADLRLCFRMCKKPVFSQRGSYN